MYTSKINIATLKTIYPVRTDRSPVFSNTRFNTCFERESSSSSMDRFLTRREQKTEYEFTSLGPAVCVLGRTGIGKSWTVRDALRPHVEITADILKSKQDTINFLERVKGTNTPIILDEYECVHDLVGLREIKEPPTKGQFIVVSQIPVKFEFEIAVYDFPIPTFEDIKRIAPGIKDAAIIECNGDLRRAIQSLTFRSDSMDDFQGPRDFVASLVSRASPGVNPVHFIGHPLAEPGNISSILHENYVDTRGATIDFLARVSADFSTSGVFEDAIYEGNWNLIHYYNLFGCILPAVAIRHGLGQNLRPGSSWTKHQNMCMRLKRIKAMATRRPGQEVHLDVLMTLRDYAEAGNAAILREYNLQPQDVYVLNHMSPLRNIKPKVVAMLKKELQ